MIALVELLDGVVWMGEHRLAFSRTQIEAAERIGIDLRAGSSAPASGDQPASGFADQT